jgi:hypothetical protein
VITGGPMMQPNELALSLVGLQATSGAGACNIAPASGWTSAYNDDQCNADFTTFGRGMGFGVAYKEYTTIQSRALSHTWTHKAAEWGAGEVIIVFRGAMGATPGSGSNNTAAGSFALTNNTTGSNNTAFGAQALYNNTTGSNNTAVGYNAGPAGDSVSANVTAAASNGGVVRLTIPSGIAANFAPTSNIVVAGVGGITGANGTWPVIRWVDATHIDLIGSSGSGTYTSGGTVSVGGNTVSVTGATVGLSTVTGVCGTGPGTLGEWADTTVTCAGGRVVTTINFASFGTPTGTCGSYATSACHDVTSTSVVAAQCLGQTTCAVQASVNNFDDPCAGTPKYLYIQATCATPTPPGVIRLTLATPYALANGVSVTVSGLAAAGVTGAPDNTYTIANATATTIDLSGTTFGGTYTSGGSVCVGACGALSNTTAIGYNAQVFASNTIRFGDTNVTSIGGANSWTAASDRRLKTDIADSDLGLGFIMKLHPVSYHLVKGNGRLDYGFIAQDVQAALGDRLTNMASQDADPMQTWRLRYSDLLAPAVAAVQEQQKTEERQRQEIDALKARLVKLKDTLKALAAKKRGVP